MFGSRDSIGTIYIKGKYRHLSFHLTRTILMLNTRIAIGKTIMKNR
jgi:hypothetical protein